MICLRSLLHVMQKFHYHFFSKYCQSESIAEKYIIIMYDYFLRTLLLFLIFFFHRNFSKVKFLHDLKPPNYFHGSTGVSITLFNTKPTHRTKNLATRCPHLWECLKKELRLCDFLLFIL